MTVGKGRSMDMNMDMGFDMGGAPPSAAQRVRRDGRAGVVCVPQLEAQHPLADATRGPMVAVSVAVRN